MKKITNNKEFFRFSLNNKFTSKLVLVYGICLGGHMQLLKLTTSSVVFGLRTKNLIINSNVTLIELAQICSIIEGLGGQRAVLYFINSALRAETLLLPLKPFGYLELCMYELCFKFIPDEFHAFGRDTFCLTRNVLNIPGQATGETTFSFLKQF